MGDCRRAIEEALPREGLGEVKRGLEAMAIGLEDMSKAV